MRQRESAICLRTTDYSETSQVVHFLTRGWGVVRLLAKGAKRPKSSSGGAIDLLGEGELVFIARSGSALGTLVEFTETVSHAPLRKDAARLNTALYMIELAGAMLAEGDPHPEIFDLLHNGLARMADEDAPVTAVLAYTQWRLLRHVGLLGEMHRCVSCGGPVLGASGQGSQGHASRLDTSRAAREACFSSLAGGLLCGGCEAAATEKLRLDAATLAGIAALTAAEAGKKVMLPDKQAKAVARMLAYHVSQQLGRHLKTARYVIG